MSAEVAIVAWIGTFLALGSAALLFGRMRGLPKAGRRQGMPKVSVIVPARDEEANLSKLLPALNAQTVVPHEILVVNDQSSDRTPEVARGAGARVIEGQPLPDGWFGKPWACQQGADTATGDWLWFIDADVEPEPDALERFATLMEERAVVSVCPWHRIERPYEELSVFFNLLMIGGIGASTWEGDDASGIGLFGQTLLVPRGLYDEFGGHRIVRKTVLENLHLSKHLEERGIRRICRVGRGAISMRMFPGGFGQLMDSWSKGSVSGAGLCSRRTILLSSIWITGMMMVMVSAAMIPLADGWHRPLAGLAFLTTAIGLLPLMRNAGGFSWWNAFAFPVGLLFYHGLFLRAAMRQRRGGTTQWKGRDVA